jgi:AAA+ ATPase superfamily predicted ATPase
MLITLEEDYMYFNPHVKEKREDFFNYETLQNDLIEAIEDKLTPMIAIYGLRRTGKTSLIKVVLNSLRKKHIWIDGRDIQSREDFKDKLFNETKKLKKISISNMSIKGIELKLGFVKEGLEYLNKHGIVLVIDEAQLLRRIHLDNTIAYIYDNYPKIKIILSGSEIGMLMSFLGKENAKAPLYGRAVFELQTYRLEREGSYQFLLAGAHQSEIQLKEEDARDAVAQLDGIIGWLTKYGWYRLKFSHKESLKRTIAEGKYIAKDEFIKFAVRAEKRYMQIIKTIREGAKWEEIKKKTIISDKQLSSMLKRLIGHGFVVKKDNTYTIADPLLEAAI